MATTPTPKPSTSFGGDSQACHHGNTGQCYICELASTVVKQDQEIQALRAERDRLRAFAQEILRGFPEGTPDCFEVQEFAVEHGLLDGVEVTEPCAPDGACWCEEWDDFPQTCYRKTEMLTGRGEG